MTMAVSNYRYQTRRNDEPLRTRLVELAREKPRFGYRRLHVLLGRSGEHVNHKRVHRVYRKAGLMIRRKKRKHCVRVGQPLRAWTAANQDWALGKLKVAERSAALAGTSAACGEAKSVQFSDQL
jgi:putative transposase